MPSYARKHQLEGSLIYHVYNRSHGKTFIFNDEEDFGHFKKLLKIYRDEFEAKIYHWVIMSNHYHLLLEMADPEEISKMMAGLARAYTHYHHRKYEATGYLWQGRFKLQPVEGGNSMLACGRYIERNPVRAGMVKAAWDYPQGSARYYCEGREDGITQEDLSFAEFGEDKTARCQAYKEFLRKFDHEDEAHFRQFENPAGSKMFVKRLVREGYRFLPRRRGRPGSRNSFTTALK